MAWLRGALGTWHADQGPSVRVAPSSGSRFTRPSSRSHRQAVTVSAQRSRPALVFDTARVHRQRCDRWSGLTSSPGLLPAVGGLDNASPSHAPRGFRCAYRRQWSPAMNPRDSRSQKGHAMSHFVETHYDELVAMCRRKVALRLIPRPTAQELEHGIPMFLRQMADMLGERPQDPDVIKETAAQHGGEMQLGGFTIAQVVH